MIVVIDQNVRNSSTKTKSYLSHCLNVSIIIFLYPRNCKRQYAFRLLWNIDTDSILAFEYVIWQKYTAYTVVNDIIIITHNHMCEETRNVHMNIVFKEKYIDSRM